MSSFSSFLKGRVQLRIPFYGRDFFRGRGLSKPVLNHFVVKGSVPVWNLSLIDMGFEGNVHVFIVADGGERVVSFVLFLCALASRLHEFGYVSEYMDIRDNYLVNTGSDLSSKLVLYSYNDKFLNDITRSVTSCGEYADNLSSSLPLFRAYARMYNCLDNHRSSTRNGHYHVKTVYNNLTKLHFKPEILGEDSVSGILVDNYSSGTGSFDECFRIKNYILSILPDDCFNYYRNVWLEVENLKYVYYNMHGVYIKALPDIFIITYLTLKLGRAVSPDNLFSEFTKYLAGDNISSIIDDISIYLDCYRNLFLRMEEDSSLVPLFDDIYESCFKHGIFCHSYYTENHDNIRNIEVLTVLIEFYRDYKKKIIDKNEFIRLTRIVEGLVIRLDLCDIEVNTTLISCYNNISKDNYINSFIMNITGHDIYPSDEKIRDELKHHEFYKESIAKYLLKKIECGLTGSGDFTSYSIEHIMPQTLTSTWKKDLSGNYEDIHRKYTNVLGNLTLIKSSDNSSLSNKSFNEKLNKKANGYKYSNLRLNTERVSAKTPYF